MQGQHSPRPFSQPPPASQAVKQPSSPAVTPRTARLPDTGDAQWTSALAAPAREPDVPLPEPDKAVREAPDPLVKAPLMADALQQQVRTGSYTCSKWHPTSLRWPWCLMLRPGG